MCVHMWAWILDDRAGYHTAEFLSLLWGTMTGAVLGMVSSMTWSSTGCLDTQAIWCQAAVQAARRRGTAFDFQIARIDWQKQFGWTCRNTRMMRRRGWLQGCMLPWLRNARALRMMEYLKRVSLKRTPESFTFAFAGRTPSRVQELRDREFAGTIYEEWDPMQSLSIPFIPAFWVRTRVDRGLVYVLRQ